MAEMSMNEIIHAAVRRDLGRFETALRSFPAGDGSRARQLRRAWATIDRQLTHHHESEDAHVWPYVRSLGVVDPALLDSMVREHEDMSRGLASVSAALDALVADPTTERAGSAAEAVTATARVTIGHLDHEERDIMPVIMEREDTPEWKAVEKQLRKGSPSHAGELFAWLQDGGDPRGLTALTRTVPAPVRLVLSKGFGRSYHREVAPAWR
jgi:hypothetical protein